MESLFIEPNSGNRANEMTMPAPPAGFRPIGQPVPAPPGRETGHGADGILPPRPNLDACTFAQPPAEVTLQTAAQTSPPLHRRTAEMYRQIFEKFFSLEREAASLVYDHELEAAAKKFNLRGREFLQRALEQLNANSERLKYDPNGRILNAGQAGEHLAALTKLLYACADVFVLRESVQLSGAGTALPFSAGLKSRFSEIAACGQTGALLLIKKPPYSAAKEIQEITNAQMGGLLEPWQDKQFVKGLSLSPALRAYLEHATVQMLCTGQDGKVLELTRRTNQELESRGGFEDQHSFKVTKSVAQNEKQESLRHSLYICGALVAVVKALEVFWPNALHAVSGVLDDALSAGPGLSQDLGPKKQPWRERIKPIIPGLKALGVSLAIAAGLGYGSAEIFRIFHEYASMRALAGLMFAFACCGGTVGVALSAIKNQFRSLSALQQKPECPGKIKELGFFGKCKAAFAEAIWSSPFRIGQIGLGVPLQIGLGVAAGLAGFFHNGAFVMFEGAAETMLGAAVAFAYPLFSSAMHRRKLRKFL